MTHTLSKNLAAVIAVALAIFTSSTLAADEPIKDYMTGEVRHLSLVRSDVNFHDVIVSTAADIDGKRAERLEDKKGKVLLVTFWQQDCLPCRRNLKGLAKIQDELGKDALEVVAINMDRAPIAKIRKVLDQRGLGNLPAYQDFSGNIVARLVRDPAFSFYGREPKTLVVGPAGRVRAVANVRKDWTAPEAKALLTALANGKV